MSYIEKIHNKNYREKKVLTQQNSPFSIKKRKHISNNNSNINIHKKFKKIEIKRLSKERKKNNRKILKEEKQNDIPKTLNMNCSSTKEIKVKNLKIYDSPEKYREELENSKLLQKLKNIQIQTNLIKDELKKYKKIEKHLENQRKQKNKPKTTKNIETVKETQRINREKSNKKNKNIKITIVNDNKNSQRTARNLSHNSERSKNKKILIDMINELFDDKKSPITINYKEGSRFIQFKNNELINNFSSNSKNKNQKQNKSVENRKKMKLKKNYNLSYNITELNKSKNKNKSKYISGDQSFNNKNKNISPIKKIRNKEYIVKTERKNYYKKIKHKNEKSISTHLNSKSNLKIDLNEDKEKSNKKLMKARLKIFKSEENLEKKNNIKFNESKVKTQPDISLELLTENREKEKFKGKEIFKIEKLCKKGYDGEGVDKPNQDNFFIYSNFNNDSNNIYMGVCDGHGQFGHDISSFLVMNLPLVLGNFLRIFNIKDISNIDNATIFPIVASSFKQVNKNLSLENNIDTTLSGSTCVSLIYTPKKVFCINIGDSRCIIGKFDGKKWKPKNLSNDHKPDLEIEKDRIIKSGGIIRPMREEDGEFIGPQRIWVKDANLPGLAMSRSFGDEVAHQIGVSTDPEIIEYELHEEDKFIILASDGIWEFMSNQEVVDIVKDYYINENCKGAIKHLYKESCNKWIEEENLIDDITLIIVFFK